MQPRPLQHAFAFTLCDRYLSDGSLQLDMPRSIDKSHYDTGGLLLRRQKIVNDRTGRPFQVQDFMLGGCYELFAFRFRIGTYRTPWPRCFLFLPHVAFFQGTSMPLRAQLSSNAGGHRWVAHWKRPPLTLLPRKRTRHFRF
jgi:hypothetical protein